MSKEKKADKQNFAKINGNDQNSFLIKFICLILLFCILSISACRQDPSDSGNPGDSDISGNQGGSFGSLISNPANSPAASPTTKLTVTPAATITQPAASTVIDAPVIKDVEFPANIKLRNPDYIYDVPSSLKTQWMTYLTLFPDSDDCKMLLYADPQIVQIDETVDRMSGEPFDSENHETKENIGLLIAMNSVITDYKVEMLKVNLEFNGTEWAMVPVKNIAKAKIPLTQQLRIVSPRLPISKAEVNDTSKLKIFDPAPFTSPGKSPYRMRAVCIEPFMAMLNQSKKDGIKETTVRDIYRSYNLQELLFQSKIKEYQNAGLSYDAARAKAETSTAAPGTSEHHDGFTADVTTYKVEMVQKTGLSPLGNWLKDNCWDYGFIIRYMKGKEEQTTKIYEPWHVRYLGLPTSLFLKRYGIVLDEFHAYLARKQYIITSFPDTSNDPDKSEPAYIYVRCKSADDILIPQDVMDSAYTLLSEVGDGSVVLMQRVHP